MDTPFQTPAAAQSPAAGTTAVPATAASAAVAATAPLGGGGAPAATIGAGLLLAALAVVGLLAARRRRRVPRLVELVETASLGPKRSLVVARMGDELLLLGASEGGISLLATRAATAAARPAFDRFLSESAEDVELRRKLSSGDAGSVR